MIDETRAMICKKIEEFWNKGNPALLPELFDTNYVHFDPNNPEVHDLESYTNWFSSIHAAFPDFQISINDTIVEGDKLVLRWTARGTHTGVYMGIPPSGQHITFTGLNVYSISDGKIAEAWFNYDAIGMMQQLGAMSVQAHAWEQIVTYHPSYN